MTVSFGSYSLIVIVKLYSNEPVDNSKRLVKVQNRLCNLLNDVSGQILTQVGKFDQLIEQFPTGTKFHYDVAVLIRFDAVDKFGYIGMVQLSHNFDLLFDISFLFDY
jgi:hypothetical protein